MCSHLTPHSEGGGKIFPDSPGFTPLTRSLQKITKSINGGEMGRRVVELTILIRSLALLLKFILQRGVVTLSTKHVDIVYFVSNVGFSIFLFRDL